MGGKLLLDEVEHEFPDLLRAAGDGEPAALKVLNDTYFPDLVSFLRRLNAEDPEHLANLALFDGIKALHTLRKKNPASLRSFLRTCAINRLRTEARRKRLVTLPLTHDIVPDTRALDPADLAVEAEWFTSASTVLPADQLAVVKERFVGGSTIAETAERLGKTQHAVKNLQVRALGRLRRHLLMTGGVLAVLLVAITLALASRVNAPSVRTDAVDRGQTVVSPLEVERSEDHGADVIGGATDSRDPASVSTPTAPSTSVPPTSVPPTSVPPTSVPPTSAATETVSPSVSASDPSAAEPGSDGPQPTVPTSQRIPSGVDEAVGPLDGEPPVSSEPAPISPTSCGVVSATASPAHLAPLTGAMVEVVVTFASPFCDDSDFSTRLVSVTSNQSIEVGNDVAGAAVGDDDRSVELLANRDGSQDRVYTLTWHVIDPTGNASDVSVDVVASPTQRGGRPEGSGNSAGSGQPSDGKSLSRGVPVDGDAAPGLERRG